MTDTYANFAELAANTIEGTDWHIEATKRASNRAYIAIHGGGIEKGTSELVLFAANGVHSEYAFEGWRTSNNGELHITSANFDEPIALDIVEDSYYVTSFHGCDGTEKHTLIGGLDSTAKQDCYDALTAAGFSCEIVPVGGYLAGTDPDNICNKGIPNAGLQLELTTAQRSAFFGTDTRAQRKNTTLPEFHAYVAAVVSVYA